MEEFGYGVLALLAAGLGTLGGLGGAVLLVPALVVSGMPASEAAPLGLLTVAAASIAAGPRQLEERAVNHRLGVTTELLASSGAVVGALVSGLISDFALTLFLAVVAVGAALASGTRSGQRNPPDPACRRSDIGERIGSLSGAYPLGDTVVPYEPSNVGRALGFMALAGFVAGTAGASGGFIKTPATTELMRVPMKVAAATTTFTVGVTSAAALIVFAIQGRIDPDASGLVIVGSLLGGRIGARLQSRMRPSTIRRVLSVLLVLVAVVLVIRGMSETREPVPAGVVSTIRGRWQAPGLTWVTRVLLVIGGASAVLPGDADRWAGIVAVIIVVAIPLARVAWLVMRWGQDRDRRFVTLGSALLSAVALGAALAAAGVGR